MPSSDEEFAVAGPTHMMVKSGISASSPAKMIDIDWDNDEHRRCVTACLVKGTYVLESDRTNRRMGTPAALAPAWWESFQFRLNDVLAIPCKLGIDWFIYGAVFEYMCPDGDLCRHRSAPRYIVAFRGTMPKDPTFFDDVGRDLRIIFNEQHGSSLFVNARVWVRQLLDYAPSRDAVWLAGHSLGASMALDVGREMMIERRCKLPTFLFNPPHVSLAPAADMLELDEQAKWNLYSASYLVKDVLGRTILGPQMKHMRKLFKRLSTWEPELYVHQKDPICSGYIDYFEQRKRLQERFPGEACLSAAALDYRDMLHLSSVSDFGHKQARQHLLPTAMLWKNLCDGDAHELRQWWQPKLVLGCNRYSLS